MIREVLQTEAFDQWFQKLRDRQAKARIATRIRRLTLNNPGDVRSVGDGIRELRIHYGAGYRLYFAQISDESAILFLGGTKNTQDFDIKKAIAMAQSPVGERSDG